MLFRSYVGAESTFGTTPASTFPNAMTAAVFSDSDVSPALAETMLELDDESIYRADAKHPVHGLQSEGSTVMLKRYLRATPSANLLTASGSAAAPSSSGWSAWWICGAARATWRSCGPTPKARAG